MGSSDKKRTENLFFLVGRTAVSVFLFMYIWSINKSPIMTIGAVIMPSI